MSQSYNWIVIAFTVPNVKLDNFKIRVIRVNGDL